MSHITQTRMCTTCARPSFISLWSDREGVASFNWVSNNSWGFSWNHASTKWDLRKGNYTYIFYQLCTCHGIKTSTNLKWFPNSWIAILRVNVAWNEYSHSVPQWPLDGEAPEQLSSSMFRAVFGNKKEGRGKTGGKKKQRYPGKSKLYNLSNKTMIWPFRLLIIHLWPAGPNMLIFIYSCFINIYTVCICATNCNPSNL